MSGCLRPRIVNGIEVPCGGCSACKRKSRNSLAIRAQWEAIRTPFQHMASLTFRDDALPPDDAEFHRLLRQVFRWLTLPSPRGLGQRGFALADVAPRTGRPHFHAAGWGPVPECGVFGLDWWWRQRWPHGFVQISLGDERVAEYLVRHNLKAVEAVGSFSPKLVRSTRPPIGLRAYLDSLLSRPDQVQAEIARTRDVPSLLHQRKDGRLVAIGSVPREFKARARDLFDVPSDDPLRLSRLRAVAAESLGSPAKRAAELKRRRVEDHVSSLRASRKARLRS